MQKTRKKSLYPEVEVFCAKLGYLGSGKRGLWDREQGSGVRGQCPATCQKVTLEVHFLGFYEHEACAYKDMLFCYKGSFSPCFRLKRTILFFMLRLRQIICRKFRGVDLVMT